MIVFLLRSSAKAVKYIFNVYATNTLTSLIKVHKDALDNYLNGNVIYKINCSSCDMSYVGQTNRKLRTRISEHQRDFHLAYDRQSVVSKHRSDSRHDYLWNDVEILDIEKYIITKDSFRKCCTSSCRRMEPI